MAVATMAPINRTSSTRRSAMRPSVTHLATGLPAGMRVLAAMAIVVALFSSVPTGILAEAADSSSGITILLMGVDKASGDEFDVGVRPDALMVLHLDPANGSCRILGIPRDSRVEIPGIGLTKVNHALSQGGIPLQRSVVEDFLGISIDHFGLIDFQALTSIVDSVGGISVNNPYAFDVGRQHFAAGLITLDGESALRFARFRGGPDGDFGRVGRQQLVVRAVLQEVTSASPLQMVPQLLRAVEGHFRTDMSPPRMISLATQFQRSCTAETLETRTLTGENAMFNDPLLQQDLWYVVQDPEEVEAAVRWLIEGQ